MVTLSDVEELPVGPELNDIGQVQEGERVRDASGRRHVFHPTISAKPKLPQMNLAEQHVPGSNNTYYIPDFVTTDEETYLLRKVSWQNLPITHTPGSEFKLLPTIHRFWRRLSRNGSNFRTGGMLYCGWSFFVIANSNRLQTWGDSSG
jgi:hypothetical protein